MEWRLYLRALQASEHGPAPMSGRRGRPWTDLRRGDSWSHGGLNLCRSPPATLHPRRADEKFCPFCPFPGDSGAPSGMKVARTCISSQPDVICPRCSSCRSSSNELGSNGGAGNRWTPLCARRCGSAKTFSPTCNGDLVCQPCQLIGHYYAAGADLAEVMGCCCGRFRKEQGQPGPSRSDQDEKHGRGGYRPWDSRR